MCEGDAWLGGNGQTDDTTWGHDFLLALWKPHGHLAGCCSAPPAQTSLAMVGAGVVEDAGYWMGSAAAPGPCVAVKLRGAVIPTAGLPCSERRIADMLARTWNKAGAGPRQLGSSQAFPRGSWPLGGREGG